MTHPIENIMKSTMEQINQMVDVNTIVGDPIVTGKETMILPVSKVCLGFLSGGGEYSSKMPVKKAGSQLDADTERYPFAGTCVAGMCITPMAFLSVTEGGVRVMPVQYKCSVDKMMDMLPDYISRLGRPTGRVKPIETAMNEKDGGQAEE